MTPEPEPPAAADRPRVLLVDDEAQLLGAMQAALGAHYAVDTATTAAEGEKLLAAKPYAVIVCDHLLPGEAGLDFLVRMRERHPGVRRILLTGYINAELLSRSVAVAELAACLIKPVPAADLLRVVGAAARR